MFSLLTDNDDVTLATCKPFFVGIGDEVTFGKFFY